MISTGWHCLRSWGGQLPSVVRTGASPTAKLSVTVRLSICRALRNKLWAMTSMLRVLRVPFIDPYQPPLAMTTASAVECNVCHSHDRMS